MKCHRFTPCPSVSKSGSGVFSSPAGVFASGFRRCLLACWALPGVPALPLGLLLASCRVQCCVHVSNGKRLGEPY